MNTTQTLNHPQGKSRDKDAVAQSSPLDRLPDEAVGLPRPPMLAAPSPIPTASASPLDRMADTAQPVVSHDIADNPAEDVGGAAASARRTRLRTILRRCAVFLFCLVGGGLRR